MKAKIPANIQYIYLTLFVIVIAIILFAFFPYLADIRRGCISRELQRQGYYVYDINFKFIRYGENPRQRIYQSSDPIYFEGSYVYQWLFTIHIHIMGRMKLREFSVEPYIPLDIEK